MISDVDISVVVQGAILKKSAGNITQNTTLMVCQRIKKLLPNCELILSTWEGEDVTGIPFDKHITSVDPGATWFNYENFELLNNCNRLIVSSLAGIKAASRQYVLKLRSDLFICTLHFLTYFDKFPLFNPEYKFVKNRILSFSLFSILGHKTSLFTMYRPYHISDWAYFGYHEDLIDLFDIPLTTEPEFSQWFLTRCKPFFDIEPHRLWKMPPEQYITSSFLNKHTTIDLKHTADISNNNQEKSRQLLVNNFLVLDQTQFALISLKYVNFQLLFEPLLSRTAIFFSTWLKDYCHYMPLTKFKKIQYKLQLFLREIFYRVMNPILRFVERKSGLINKLTCKILSNYKN